ncbi:hypothetical protein AMK68_01445, partial [candidate division KD3-62 bacterium DG_56]
RRSRLVSIDHAAFRTYPRTAEPDLLGHQPAGVDTATAGDTVPCARCAGWEIELLTETRVHLGSPRNRAVGPLAKARPANTQQRSDRALGAPA